MENRRAWSGDEWQEFALKLVQMRHQPQNVQIVPDKVKGDAGIEFFSTDGCLYQCYAPEETIDVQKAASAMKTKARRDIAKLEKFKDTVSTLLCGMKAKRWILLCPFLDDKAVVADVRQRGAALRALALGFLEPTFDALVQSQTDFANELEQLRLLSLGAPLQVAEPADDAVLAASSGEMNDRLVAKLKRGFGQTLTPVQLESQRLSYVRAHLYRENALTQMQLDHPALWDRSIMCIDSEEARLVAIGGAAALPAEQLRLSLDRIEGSLRSDLPGISNAIITRIAVGTISDWLIRCPLDFPN